MIESYVYMSRRHLQECRKGEEDGEGGLSLVQWDQGEKERDRTGRERSRQDREGETGQGERDRAGRVIE